MVSSQCAALLFCIDGVPNIRELCVHSINGMGFNSESHSFIRA